MKSPLNGRESGSIQEVLELRGIKTRTGFLNARQIAMPQDGTDARKTVVKILNQMLHRLLLLRSAGVADAARWRKTTLVTDAYAVRIVTEGMRAHTLYRATGMNHSIQRDVEMVADVSPAVVMNMVVAQHLHRITVIAAAAAAMHHYHIDVSHRLLLKSTCRNAQRPEESCQYGYCKLENLIPFLLVLFCHNLFCFKRLIILIRLQCHRCQCYPCRRSARLRCCHPWYRRQKEHCPWQAFS